MDPIFSFVNCWNLLQENGAAAPGCVFLPFETAALLCGAEGFSCEERNEENCRNESIVFDDAVELLDRPWREAVAVAGRSAGASVVGATPRYIEEYGPLP